MKNIVEFLYSKFLQSDGISIDTRTLEKGNLFFAIKGPNFDGNQYAQKALDAGASFAVVDNEDLVNKPGIIVVEDTLLALQDLARFHRGRFKRVVLGITGSNGKTTTKELIHRVLQNDYITLATQGNLNNHLGVPITLLNIYPQVEIAIVEMGANHVGEIANLCTIAQPNYGLITNIGEAHTETFGGIEGVLRGKSELFDHLRQTEGTPFINCDDFRLENMRRRFERSVDYPSDDLELISSDPYLKLSLNGQIFQTNLVGKYNFGNVAAAVAVGRRFDISDNKIIAAISSYVPKNLRSEVLEIGGMKIINDCYNANPTSMSAAIESLAAMNGTKAVILGDMKEVENSKVKHRELGRIVLEARFDKAIFIGQEMQEAQAMVEGAIWYGSVEELLSDWQSLNLNIQNVLIKASRSMRLDLIAEQLSTEKNE